MCNVSKRLIFGSVKGLLLVLTVSALLLTGVSTTLAGSMGIFMDPEDGFFDTSDWLLERKGFLPVPIIITEPAVGYGGGAGVFFFHDSIGHKISKAMKKEEQGKLTRLQPPSISGVFGFKTENGTWGAGGMHFGSWKGDRIRYLGGGGIFSVNLKYYGRDEGSWFENGLDYNLDLWGVLQDMKFRMGDSDVFVGGRVVYSDTTSTFAFGDNIPGIYRWELDFRDIGLGLVFQYDSRDNIFTPNQGVNTNISAMFYNGEGLLSNTREYQITEATSRAYWTVRPDLILGWRVEGNFSFGDVPFYSLPFINLRGIPAARYQGDHVLETELEVRYQLTERWSLLPFGGVGMTAKSLDEFGSSRARWAGGMGFRYLIARKLRLQSGIDIARGPEGWAFYIQVGSGL